MEDDWEAALVHISHPPFNQQQQQQSKQNWTEEDSKKYWMKTDIKFMPKRTEGTPLGKIPKQISLSPGYYNNLKEAWIAIAYEIEKHHMEVMMTISRMDIDDAKKRKQLADANLSQPYIKISNANIAEELDSLYILIPPNLSFEMEWKMAGLLGARQRWNATHRTRKQLSREKYRRL